MEKRKTIKIKIARQILKVHRKVHKVQKAQTVKIN
jgi:hypothetical protein